jgi:Protein kinase domain/Concanavalin A-like lectin/glucanases superfamily
MPDDPPTPDSSPPVTDHELIRLIGRGSYGEVWLARNALGTYRAIKIVYEKTFRDKRPFEREFNGVQKFEPISRLHDGLMDVLQVGRNDAAGYFYCVMELADDVVSGQSIDPEKYSPRTLGYDLAKHRRLPIEECHRVGLAIASALEFLHGHGLVHRDVKPNNVVFVNGVPKLADIGLVTELSSARSYVGTEGFIPPEGPGTVQADLYSFGKVLYEISTGKDRHEYPEPATLVGDPTHEAGLIEFNKIILRACRADPKLRYASAAEMKADLLAAHGGARLPSETASRRSSAKMLARIAAAVAVAGGCFLAFRAANAPPGAVPAPDGLVGWWRAENNGEDSAGTNHGRLYGVDFDEGKVGRAFNMFPPSHRVYIADSDDFKLTNSLTIEGWIFLRTFMPQAGAYIFVRGDSRSGLDPFALDINPAGQLDFNLAGSRTNYVNLRVPFPLREWKHVAATLEGTTGEMRIYIDGAVVARTNTAVRPLRDLDPAFDPSIGIGNVGPLNWNFPFDGMIDEITLYSRALSPAEIQRIYRAGSAGKKLSTPAHPPPPLVETKSAPKSGVPAPSGLIGWWPGEGDARDLAGTNHGILRNGVSFAPGRVGKAFRFNGTNSFVEIPRAPCFDVSNQVTIEFWMKADTDNPMITCCQGLVTSDFYLVEISSTEEPIGVDFCIANRYGTSTNTCDANRGAAVISSGEWHHIAGTYDGTQLQLYVDGAPWRKPTPCTGAIPPMLADSFISIGSEDGRKLCPYCIESRYFKGGLIDEVSIYNRALTASEITAIYHAGSAGKIIGSDHTSATNP